MMTDERLDEMERSFWSETEDPETRAWRDFLSPYEAVVVAGWDDKIDVRICRFYEKLAEWAAQEAVTS